MSAQQKQARLAALQQEVAELQSILGENANANDIVSEHITLLHRYNEAKDATQILIGKLAMHRGTTIREIHDDYGLTTDD
ncbi:hypothetical protein EUX98_g3962 [Antrodiella citrinella]|uniref:DNA repair protein SWI5 homolog n=1 Tax=Antrodiella citrinella TaxID=2447956 RepID=A0A4S4MXQ6_9APHY|nr:hypothetical protein EUX98_g3962 [Antrodiella citrinella]